MIYDCIITGAGASGLFCAASVSHPLKGLILEKSKYPGLKLLMSGSGQCNITHAGSIKDFISCYGDNGRKIRKCLYKYNNISLMEFLKNNGIKTITRDDGKVFPASMNAHHILDMLLDKTEKNGFSINFESPVENITKCEQGWKIFSGSNNFICKTLVIASGGCSYPSTGSDGSMFTVLKRDLNLTSTRLKPALAPIQVKAYPYGELSGISFKNSIVTILNKGYKNIQNCGGLLFTHKDFSGPAVMNVSKYASAGDELKINYLGSLSYEDALLRLKKAAHKTNAELSTVISEEFSLPKRFSRLLEKRYGTSLKKLAGQLTGESFEILSTSGFNKAMCTCGGIELSQINPSSMDAVKNPNIFIIGEALDIDGITGGYNLQFAYSSANAAADRISKLLVP